MKIGSLFDSRPLAELKAGHQQPASTARDDRKSDGVDSSDNSNNKIGRKADKLLRLEQESSSVYNRKDFATRSNSNENINQVRNRSELIQEIKDRVESGYYDRDDVINKVVDKLTDEFND